MKYVILTMAAMSTVLLAQTPKVLDLTQRRPESDVRTTGRVTVPVSSPGSHSVREQLPLEVTLAWMDRTDYHEYDPFTFRVVLRNRGLAAITLPWEPDASRVVTSAEAPMMEWTLAVALDGPQDSQARITIATLSGSVFSPSSLLTISPGDSSEIVASGQWKFFNPSVKSRLEATLPGNVNVRAYLTFNNLIVGRLYQNLASNAVPLKLDLPRRP